MAVGNTEHFTPLDCMKIIATPRQNKERYDGLFSFLKLLNLLFKMEGKEG